MITHFTQLEDAGTSELAGIINKPQSARRSSTDGTSASTQQMTWAKLTYESRSHRSNGSILLARSFHSNIVKEGSLG